MILVVDTSALISIAKAEADANAWLGLLENISEARES
jgi:hypothetical protein